MQILLRFSIFLIPVAALQAVATQTPPSVQSSVQEIVSESSAYFEVASMDRQSVYATSQIGQASAAVCAEFLTILPNALPQRVTVILDPNLNVPSHQKPYKVVINDGGFVDLYIAWSDQLEFREVCQATTEALLIRAVYYCYSPSAINKIPAWIITGLGEEVLLRFRPALMEAYALELKDLKPTEVNAAFNAKSVDECDSVAALGIIAAIDSVATNKDDFRQLLDRALLGLPIQERLESKFKKANKGNDDAHWWEQGMQSFYARHGGVVDTMEVSRLWLKDLVNMDAFTDRTGGKRLRNLRALGSYNEDELVRKILSQRRNMIMSGMLRVNPLYYNTAQSLGRFYEQLLFGEPGFKRTTTYSIISMT